MESLRKRELKVRKAGLNLVPVLHLNSHMNEAPLSVVSSGTFKDHQSAFLVLMLLTFASFNALQRLKPNDPVLSFRACERHTFSMRHDREVQVHVFTFVLNVR